MGQAARQQSIDDWAAQNIAGSFSDADEASKRLRSAAEHCHLIGGMTVCPMPEGYEIQIIVVPINKDRTYPIKGNEGARGIGKGTLMTLATAAGVEWTVSRRMDDGRDPRYCHWHVEGRYPLIDGTYRSIEGDRDVDLRDGSDQMAGKSEKEIAGLRQNTIRNAITKAKLRAIREGFGVDQGMLIPELDKPFVFAKAVFTGRSSDPRVRRMFAAVIAQKQIMAAQALYGGAPALMASAAPIASLPAGMGAGMDVDYDDEGEVIDMPAAPAPGPPPPQAPARQSPPPQRGSAPRQSGGGGVWPWAAKRDGDPEKGDSLSNVGDEHLERLISYYEKNPGKPEWHAKNAALQDEARAIIASRSGSEPAHAPVGDGYDDRKSADDF
jgi:hypothetical protein